MALSHSGSATSESDAFAALGSVRSPASRRLLIASSVINIPAKAIPTVRATRRTLQRWILIGARRGASVHGGDHQRHHYAICHQGIPPWAIRAPGPPYEVQTTVKLRRLLLTAAFGMISCRGLWTSGNKDNTSQFLAKPVKGKSVLANELLKDRQNTGVAGVSEKVPR